MLDCFFFFFRGLAVEKHLWSNYVDEILPSGQSRGHKEMSSIWADSKVLLYERYINEKETECGGGSGL